MRLLLMLSTTALWLPRFEEAAKLRDALYEQVCLTRCAAELAEGLWWRGECWCAGYKETWLEVVP